MVACTFAITAAAGARAAGVGGLPAVERPPIPDFASPTPPPGVTLPPVELSETPDAAGLRSGVRVFVRGYRITGNSVLSEADLAAIVEPFSNREVDFVELEKLRDLLTRAYVDRGFVSSGAVIPDQRVENGTVEIDIVEGKLGEIQIETDGRLREGYVRSRMERGGNAPVEIEELEERLRVLQRDERIRRLEAELVPRAQRGESILRMRVYEDEPYWARLSLSNHRSPSVGSWGGEAQLGWNNLSGWGDSIAVDYSGSEGYQEVGGEYAVPITAWDTRIGAHGRGSWGRIVESPFDDLDLLSRTVTVGFSLRQPFHPSERDEASLGLVAEWRRSRTTLLGEGFNLGEGPSDNGVSKISVLRLEGDWVRRGRNDVVALRSTVSWGLGILGATVNTGDTPDGRFVSWLGQFQWARRLGPRDMQLIVREDFQLSSRPLLSLEQFGMGGWATVRGYRENALVRDQGLIGSIELRVPVLRRLVGPPWLEAAVFLDHGYSFERDRVTEGPRSLLSVGLGIRSAMWFGTRLEIYWGRALRHIDTGGEWDLQDSGFSMQLTVEIP